MYDGNKCGTWPDCLINVQGTFLFPGCHVISLIKDKQTTCLKDQGLAGKELRNIVLCLEAPSISYFSKSFAQKRV